MWKLPTSSHPSWFVGFFSSCYWYLGTCGDKVMQNLEIWQKSLFSQCLCEALWCHEIPLSSTACLAFSNTAIVGLVLHLQGVCQKTVRWMGESPSSQVGWTASFTAITFLKRVLIFYSFCERHGYLSVNYKSVNPVNLLVLQDQGCMMFRWICIPLNGSCCTHCVLQLYNKKSVFTDSSFLKGNKWIGILFVDVCFGVF